MCTDIICVHDPLISTREWLFYFAHYLNDLLDSTGHNLHTIVNCIFFSSRYFFATARLLSFPQ
jgi:hypothetical protein